jgi:anaplastic lymphoma kinase
LVAGGGGGLGIGRYFDDDLQHGQMFIKGRKEISGQVQGEYDKNAGPGGGWQARTDSTLNSNYGAALLEGGRGGIPCYAAKGKFLLQTLLP